MADKDNKNNKNSKDRMTKEEEKNIKYALSKNTRYYVPRSKYAMIIIRKSNIPVEFFFVELQAELRLELNRK